jgi:hypothetical protein
MKRLILSVLLLVTGFAQVARGDSSLVFTEIMYHPATNEPQMEWVELRNELAADLDISEWSLTGGIQYTFPSNTIIRGSSYVLVALSPENLELSTGLTNIHGPFSGRLSNNGETLRVRDLNGRVVEEVTYGIDDEWPPAADGSGVSLAKRDPDSGSSSALSLLLEFR